MLISLIAVNNLLFINNLWFIDSNIDIISQYINHILYKQGLIIYAQYELWINIFY